MNPIIIFYHCLFYLGDPPQLLPPALDIVSRQMNLLGTSGLLEAASEFHVGVNGGTESEIPACVTIPTKAQIIYHGLQSRNENLTIVMVEEWLKNHPDEAYILYFHAKGSTHPISDPVRNRWRGCMERNLISKWKNCVSDLATGSDAAGCHWMSWGNYPQMPKGQSIFGGNFFWAKASFLRTLPSIFSTDRVKQSGILALESRYESEVWIGNGPRLPRVRDYHNGWNVTASTCIP